MLNQKNYIYLASFVILLIFILLHARLFRAKFLYCKDQDKDKDKEKNKDKDKQEDKDKNKDKDKDKH